jgi:hypothetical protein
MLVSYVLASFDTYLRFLFEHDFSAGCQKYPLCPQFVVMQNYTFSVYCLLASAVVALPLMQSAGDTLTGDRHPNY